MSHQRISAGGLLLLAEPSGEHRQPGFPTHQHPQQTYHIFFLSFLPSFSTLTPSRRQNAYDTSDSEGGKNISAAQAYRRAIPTVLEPENMDDHADFYAPSHSRSPSPAISPSLHHQSMRLAIGGNSDSEGGWERYGPNVLPPRRRSVATTVLSNASALPNANTSPSSWAPRRVMMLRTASDGADVVADHGGLEWAVANGHGTGKRLDADHGVEHECAVTPVSPLAAPTGVAALRGATLHRSHSLQDRQHYRGMHVCDPAHLAIDVGMCDVVWKLRKREKILSKRAADMAVSADVGLSFPSSPL